MKVILLENVRKIGSIGEIIDVKRGFARNYLISKKKALFASKENIKEVEKIKQDLNKKDQDKKKGHEEGVAYSHSRRNFRGGAPHRREKPRAPGGLEYVTSLSYVNIASTSWCTNYWWIGIRDVIIIC